MAAHCGIEQTVTVGKRRYRLSRFTRKLEREFIDWCYAQAPSPLDLARLHIDDFPCPEQLAAVVTALMDFHGTPDDPTVKQLEPTREGQFKIFSLLMQGHHWKLSEDRLWSIWLKIERDWPYLLQQARGFYCASEGEAERLLYRQLGWLIPCDGKQTRPTNWAEIDFNLFRNFNLTPAQVDQMTLPEIVCISTEQDAGEAYTVQSTAAAQNSTTALYKNLTAAQRLWLVEARTPISRPVSQ